MFIIITLVFLASYIFWIFNVFEPDFFHLANTGRELCSDMSNLYYNDNFVIEGYPTLIQQWLYCILVYKIYELFGYMGITIFIYIQFFIMLYVFTMLAKEFGLTTKIAWFVSLLSIIPFDYLNVRPQMFSIILLCIELILLERYKKSNKSYYLYILPILIIIEMNFHMTFWIFHYVVILPYIFPLRKLISKITNLDLELQEERISIKALCLPLILMTVCLFINPYGLRGITCLIDSTSIKELNMFELAPPYIVSEDFSLITIGFLILIYLYCKKRLTTTTCLIYLGLSFMNILAIRNCTFFSIACLYAFSDFFKEQNIENLENYLFLPSKKILLLVFSVLLVYLPIKASFTLKLGKTLPDNILTYIKENETDLSDVSLFADLNVSTYFLWNGVGHIFAESKTEPYLKKINGKQDILKDYVFITKYANNEDLDEFFHKYDFDYVCVPSGYTSLRNYFANSDEYDLVCIDSNTVTVGNTEIPQWQLYKQIDG